MASLAELENALKNVKRELRQELKDWTYTWEDETERMVDDHGWNPDTFSSRDAITAYVTGDFTTKFSRYRRVDWGAARSIPGVSKYSGPPFFNNPNTYKPDWPTVGNAGPDDLVNVVLAIPLKYATDIHLGTLPFVSRSKYNIGGPINVHGPMGQGLAEAILDESLQYGESEVEGIIDQVLRQVFPP